MLRRPLLLLSLALLALTTTGLSADRRSLVSSGDAFVMADPDTGSWTIDSSTIRFTVTLDTRSGLRVMDLSNPYTGQWSVGVAPDTTVSLGSGELTLGTHALVFEGAEASQYRGGVRLDVSFISSSPPAKVTRSYVCYPRTPIVEMWTTFEPAAASRLTVANLNAFELTVQPGVIQWVNGLGTPPAEGGPFTLMSRELKPGDSLSLGAVKRSTEQALPWFKIEAEADEFFGGLIWSGSWELMLSRTEQEPIDTFPGLSLLFRSRMPGMLGVSWRGEEIGEGERKRIQREISIYKQIREIMHDANAHLLTDQVGIDGGYGWDVIQQVSASSGNALIFAFSGEEASRRINVQPRNLRRDAIYEVSSVDYGPIGQATGHELMTQGVEIDRDVDLPAHVIVLRVIGQPVPVIRR